jgi:hypothetical protein
MAETAEIGQTLERLQGAFEDMTVRGLRSAGPEHLATLAAVREELERIGAGHLAGRLAAVLDAIRSHDRAAAAALLRAQASLRVFERILTLETAAELLRPLVPSAEAEDES